MTVSPVRGSTTATRAASSYTELARAVRASGLMGRRRGYYLARIAAAVLGLATLTAGVAWLGNSWWQLVVAGLMSCVFAQAGFLGHDAAHRQVFAGAAWNEWTARILSGAVVGLSYGWWRGKHNRHHAAPNQLGRDPDIAPGVVAFTPEAAVGRTGVLGWVTRRQGWLFLPMLTLEGLSLHVSSLREVLRSEDRYRWLEASLIVARLGGLAAWLTIWLPLGKTVAFLAVQQAVFGILLGGSFAPNHTGMPIVPRGARIDFLNRQVLMSRNVRGNLVIDTVMGGLNYQIEHHLFPSMPRPHLKLVRPLVRSYCAERGIPYTELTFVASYVAVVRYLNEVGLRALTTFDCPLASQLRE